MRDLEIRGAGNLLGAEQHGQMADIGYDLYVKFLDEAIKRLQGKEPEEKIDTLIELNVDGYIPSRYIKDEEQKIEVYKRISVIETKRDYSDMIEELTDRFGDLPKQVINLLKISYIKALASKGKISMIRQLNEMIQIEFVDKSCLTMELINEILKRLGEKVRLDASNTCIIRYKYDKESQEDLLNELEDLVGKISSFINSQSEITNELKGEI